MNSVCVINTTVPYLSTSGPADERRRSVDFVERVNTAIGHGAGVVDLGIVGPALQSASSIDALTHVLRAVRSEHPEAILQIGGRNAFELNQIIEHFDSLLPDVVSVPLKVLCDEGTVTLLRNQQEEFKGLASRLIIDVDDLSMIYRAVAIHHDGVLSGRLRLDMCFGRELGVPPDRDAFVFFVQTLRKLAPEATWSGVGHGRSELELARWSVEMSGHCKASGKGTGTRAEATLPKAVQLCKEYGRRPATCKEARHILSLETLSIPRDEKT
jgi:hypothetical protein